MITQSLPEPAYPGHASTKQVKYQEVKYQAGQAGFLMCNRRCHKALFLLSDEDFDVTYVNVTNEPLLWHLTCRIEAY